MIAWAVILYVFILEDCRSGQRAKTPLVACAPPRDIALRGGHKVGVHHKLGDRRGKLPHLHSGVERMTLSSK